jgi:hypothetical protein
MSEMFRPSGVVDEYVVEEHQHEQRRNGRRTVFISTWNVAGQAEGHNQELEQAFMCAERGFGDVVGVHPHLVVAGAEVEFGEGRPAELVQQLLFHRDQEFVLDRHRVVCLVVDTKAPRPVGLLDEEHRRRE